MSWAEDEGYDAYDPTDFDDPVFEYETGIWTTAEGKRIKVKNMEVSHIKNVVAWLKRTREKVVEETGNENDLLEIDAKIEEFDEELERRSTFNNKELF